MKRLGGRLPLAAVYARFKPNAHLDTWFRARLQYELARRRKIALSSSAD